jgi:hypothetical protein
MSIDAINDTDGVMRRRSIIRLPLPAEGPSEYTEMDRVPPPPPPPPPPVLVSVAALPFWVLSTVWSVFAALLVVEARARAPALASTGQGRVGHYRRGARTLTSLRRLLVHSL